MYMYMYTYSTIISTVFQKFDARILYLAHCKIDGTRPSGGLGFGNELREIMFEEARSYVSTMYVYVYHTSYSNIY
jgi:hypothetical protein